MISFVRCTVVEVPDTTRRSAMSSQYTYDEQGQFFPYFTATVLALVLVPASVSALRSSRWKEVSDAQASDVEDTFHLPQKAIIQLVKKDDARNEIFSRKNGLLLAGWLLFGYMIYLIQTTHVENKLWDPYEILGLPLSSTEQQIKRHYKRLSLKFHPDKFRAIGNETKEVLEDRFVELTKAYKALTDEEVRRNYMEFGHPDGKQAYSIGIALPKWIVEEGSMYYILALYGALFGVALPYVVGKWWYGTKSKTKDGVSVETSGVFFRGVSEYLSEKDTMKLLAASKEYESTEFADRDEIALENKVVAPTIQEAFTHVRGHHRSALALLYAYLYRVDLGDKYLEILKFQAAAKSAFLTDALLNIETALAYLPPIQSLFIIKQCLVQAIAPGESPLLQLPGITRDIAIKIENDAKIHWPVQKLMQMSDKERLRLLSDAGIPENAIGHINRIGSTFPVIQLAAIFFVVEGEKVIPPNAFVHLVVRLRCASASKHLPPLTEEELAEKDSGEEESPEEVTQYTYSPFYPKVRLFGILLIFRNTSLIITSC